MISLLGQDGLTLGATDIEFGVKIRRGWEEGINRFGIRVQIT